VIDAYKSWNQHEGVEEGGDEEDFQGDFGEEDGDEE